jgi:hypothetical protein
VTGPAVSGTVKLHVETKAGCIDLEPNKHSPVFTVVHGVVRRFADNERLRESYLNVRLITVSALPLR